VEKRAKETELERVRLSEIGVRKPPLCPVKQGPIYAHHRRGRRRQRRASILTDFRIRETGWHRKIGRWARRTTPLLLDGTKVLRNPPRDQHARKIVDDAAAAISRFLRRNVESLGEMKGYSTSRHVRTRMHVVLVANMCDSSAAARHDLGCACDTEI